MFFTKSLLSTGSIHFFCFTFTSPKSIASARWGKMPFASRRLLDRNGNWFGEKLPGYPADPGRSQQIPADPRNFRAESWAKTTKNMAVSIIWNFMGIFMGLKQQTCGLYLIIWMNLITWLFSITGMMIGMGNHHGSSPNARTFQVLQNGFGKIWENDDKMINTWFFGSFSDKPLCWKTYPYQPFVKKRTTPLDKVSVFRFFFFFEVAFLYGIRFKETLPRADKWNHHHGTSPTSCFVWK